MIDKLKTYIPCAAILLTLASTTARASTIIVNIDAATNSYFSNPVVEILPAGTYTVTPVDPPVGIYTAWNYYAPNYLNVWLDGYVIVADSTVLVYTGFVPTFSTPGEAFANAVSSTFSLGSTTAVDFSVLDSYYGDNQGGVSLAVSSTPEPGTLALLGTGLAGIAFLLMRRARIQAV